MNSIDNLKWRYAVKKFDHHKILSDHQINILKQAFNLTATSYGLQPIKLVVVKNKDIQKELVKTQLESTTNLSSLSPTRYLCRHKIR